MKHLNMKHLQTDESLAKSEAAKALRKNPDKLLDQAGLDLSRQATSMVLDKLTQMPEGSRLRYIRALQGKSMVSAIHSQCHECMAWVTSEVPRCTSLACPLYPYRPYTDSAS